MIRRANKDDERAVARLMRENVRPVWTDEQIHAAFVSPRTDIYVCDEGGVCGYVIAERVLDEGCISSIATDESKRRRGIGRALVRAALSGDAAHWYLEVNENNAPAIALYESCGFVLAGRRPGYYGDASACIMTREAVSKDT
ncbi:MAG TPA: GNAT family N-acetyltransferase [Candidatus Protoclostridium stercorigallinarum]|uniref:GNAT family N-acetyltransferase n=1 Tax=Candidatus Protoclostridium stercorigallinarum TaxID=2838741 RepID=A0A9D1Q182_9FIRM|nr:GNAT family N-acetyltransferase [Candidatus Protoclostridium stercorigallinarum]